MKRFSFAVQFCFLFFGVTISFSQKQGSIWYFGDHAGVDFNSGNPVALTNGQTPLFVPVGSAPHAEGTAIMADSTGALLFYTNGQQIWNKNHQVMPNGNSLLGHPSSSQSSLIVPKPGSKRYYYVFTTAAYFSFQDGFRYSVVDMCLDNGLGDIVQSQKNLLLLDSVAEKLTGVVHANGKDYWILVHKFYSDAFYAYQLSNSGITNTVITHIGSYHPTGPSPSVSSGIGQMKASPNGQKIALVNANSGACIAQYFDFNKTSGVLSSSVSVQTNTTYNYTGVSFSPDNSKLYISSHLNGYGIFQFNLNAGGGHPDSIRASKVKIHSGNFNQLSLQLANDGKIYTTRQPIVSRTYLGVIKNPNLAGLACGYVDSAVSLNGKFASYGLPNFIDSYTYIQPGGLNCPGTETIITTGIDVNSESSSGLWPNPFTNFLEIRLKDSDSPILLCLYDVNGKQIYTVVTQKNERLEFADIYLPAGIYYYRLFKNTDQSIITQGKLKKD